MFIIQDARRAFSQIAWHVEILTTPIRLMAKSRMYKLLVPTNVSILKCCSPFRNIIAVPFLSNVVLLEDYILVNIFLSTKSKIELEFKNKTFENYLRIFVSSNI